MEDGEEGSLTGVATDRDKFEETEDNNGRGDTQADILDIDFDLGKTICCFEEERFADNADDDDDDDNNTDELCHDTPEVEDFFALLPE